MYELAQAKLDLLVLQHTLEKRIENACTFYNIDLHKREAIGSTKSIHLWCSMKRLQSQELN